MAFRMGSYGFGTEARAVEAVQLRIIVDIRAPVDPRASPGRPLDKPAVRSPVHPGCAPAPGAKRRAKAKAKTEIDRATDGEPGARREVDDSRIVIRHVHEIGTGRHDRNERSAAGHN